MGILIIGGIVLFLLWLVVVIFGAIGTFLAGIFGAVGAAGAIGAAAIVVGAVSYVAIKSWVDRTAVRGDTIEWIKKNLPNAVVVEVNIFKPPVAGMEQLRATQTWREASLDAELRKRFGNSDRIRLKV